MHSTHPAPARYALLSLLLLAALSLPAQEIRGVWAPVWEMNTPQKIDTMVRDVADHNGNLILAEVRYRGDAAYTPNRANHAWPNPEPRSYMIEGDFDPLDYLIRRAAEYDIAVKAWFTVMVATPHELENVAAQHIWYRHPEWITRHSNGKPMTPPEAEGAFLDPGLPQVHEYLLNVILDVVANYDIDGVQLDYIRYPGPDYGYHPAARERWRAQSSDASPQSWQRWKQEQITGFVRRCYAEVKSLRPDVEVSASVVSDLDTALGKFAQDWPTWLREGYIDTVYLMSYQESDESFERVLNAVDCLGLNERVVVGLRAWRNHSRYPVERIVSKIDILRRHAYAGLCMFSYDGLIDNGYYATLQRRSMPRPANFRKILHHEGIVLGQVTDDDGQPVEGATVTLRQLDYITTTDANGFFAFFGLEPGEYPLRVLHGERAISPDPVVLRHGGQAVRLALSFGPASHTAPANFHLEGFRENGRAVLMWTQPEWMPLSIYRRTLGDDGLFELVDILLDSTGVWVDEPVEHTRGYEYKLITVHEQTSHVLSMPAPNGERPLRVHFERDGEDYRLVLHLPLADKLSWSLESGVGEPLLSAEGWYPGGQTVERWNGVSLAGKHVSSGVYTFRSRSLLRDWTWETRVYLP